jgi:hypothetical protein
MQIPDSVGAFGRRLSLEEFHSEFLAAWQRLDRRFLKLECWQTYQEPATESLRAFLRGDRRRVDALLLTEARRDGFLYDEVVQRGLDYARIRLVQKPLTPYLAWEMWNYQVRERMGESILIAELPPSVELPNNEFFDFLLFDRSVGLVHDYGDDGLQVGGWLVSDQAMLAELETRALALRDRAVPLAAWLRTAAKPVGSAAGR